MSLKEGDLVKLKSGGPDMVIERVFDKSLTANAVVEVVSYAACSWFDENNQKHVEDFAFAALVKI